MERVTNLSILNNKYEIIESIGSNPLGNTYKVRDRTDNNLYALKVINKNKLEDYDKKNLSGRNEINLKHSNSISVYRYYKEMASLNHPNFLRVWDCFESKTNIYLVLEYYDNTNMETLINLVKAKGVHIQESFLKSLLFSVCKAFIYASESIILPEGQSLIYGKMRPSEILINDDVLKISEFSPLYSNIKWLYEHGNYSSMRYFPPEMLEGKSSFNQKFDVWSFGIFYTVFKFSITLTLFFY
jgi:serine/threonine protein kinase